MDADACRMEAKILRTAMEHSQVHQNRAWLGKVSKEWDRAADDLESCEAMSEPAHFEFVGAVVEGQRVMHSGWLEVLRVNAATGGLLVDDPETGKAFWWNHKWQASPCVARGEA